VSDEVVNAGARKFGADPTSLADALAAISKRLIANHIRNRALRTDSRGESERMGMANGTIVTSAKRRGSSPGRALRVAGAAPSFVSRPKAEPQVHHELHEFGVAM
jgi:hypothetical protein